MLAVLALALGCAACTDRSPVLAEPRPEAELLGVLQCTADVRTLQVSCTEATPETGGVSPALFGTSQVKLASSNVVNDPKTGIFGMDVTAQNLLSYAIGTPDGTTRAGFKVFFEVGPNATYYTPGDTGTVRVRNPDGLQNFTAAQQPYHFYDTILQPQEVSEAKRWEFTVPATVKSFSFSVRVFTATQREHKVPLTAPNQIPTRHYDPNNWIACFGQLATRCMKDVVRVMFQEGATGEERQSAIDHVRGRVVGGSRGFYFVTFPTDASVDSLWKVVEKLEALPQVQRASPAITESGLTVQYSLPRDGNGWTEWKLNPDSADGPNWALEKIDAPYGWGCSIGADSLTAVAVVDVGFHSQPDLTRNLNSAQSRGLGAYSGAADTIDHGTRVAAIVAAHGNDSTQMTGTMWRADLRLLDVSVDSAGVALGGAGFEAVFAAVQKAGRDGARVINMSLGARWQNSSGNFRNPATETDSAQRRRDSTFIRDLAADLQVTLDSVVVGGGDPMVVIAAGNDGIDTRWQGMAGALNGPHGHRIILVAASTRTDALWTSSNRGAPAQIAAPGAGLHTLWGNGSIDTMRTLPSGSKRLANGTSFAAPHVAGAAGLLFSFDPRLTAAQVKQLLLNGARRGNRSAGGIPILNIRESLILAGRRAGAPLCGNRIWTHGGFAYAQRDTAPGATPEQLFELPPNTAAYYLDPLHGGKAVEIAGNPRRMMRWSLTAGVPGWTAGPVPPVSYPYYQPGANGTTLSGAGRSHSLDTLFTMTAQTSGNVTTYRFRLTTPAGTDPVPGVGVGRPYAGGANVCISRFDSISTASALQIDTTPGLRESYAEWRAQVASADQCVTDGGAAQIRYSEARAAYAPEGRYAYVFFSERVGSTVPGEYSKCRILRWHYYEGSDGQTRAYPLYVFGDCRPATTITQAGVPAIYRVNVSTGVAELHTFTDAPIAQGFVVYPALREDGREMILQLRQRTMREEYTWTNVSATEQRMNYSSQTLAETCRNQFRHFRTGTILLEPPATCSEGLGISADRHAH